MCFMCQSRPRRVDGALCKPCDNQVAQAREDTRIRSRVKTVRNNLAEIKRQATWIGHWQGQIVIQTKADYGSTVIMLGIDTGKLYANAYCDHECTTPEGEDFHVDVCSHKKYLKNTLLPIFNMDRGMDVDREKVKTWKRVFRQLGG